MISEDILKRIDQKISNTYILESNRLQQEQSKLLKCIIAREDKGKYVPAFCSDVADHMKGFDDAENSVAHIEEDINQIVELFKGFESVDALKTALYRAKRQIEQAEMEARIAISKASITEGEGALENPRVQKVLDNRDKVRQDTGNILKDLESKRDKINAILNKYQ